MGPSQFEYANLALQILHSYFPPSTPDAMDEWMNAADDNCRAHCTSGHAHALFNSAQVAGSNTGSGACYLCSSLIFVFFIGTFI